MPGSVSTNKDILLREDLKQDPRPEFRRFLWESFARKKRFAIESFWTIHFEDESPTFSNRFCFVKVGHQLTLSMSMMALSDLN